MKNFNLVLLTIIFPLLSYSQDLTGKYKSEDEFINFESNRINFEIKSDGGLLVTFRGEGAYSLVDEFLVVNTGPFEGLKSTVQSICNSESKLIVENESGHPLPGVTVLFNDSNGKLIGGNTTDSNGLAEIGTLNPGMIKLISLDLDPISFPVSANCKYTATMIEGHTLENRIIVFKVIARSEKVLRLILLSTDFKSATPTLKQLRKLDKKTKKNNLRLRGYLK